jgi:siroheme synthase-like protein
MDGKSWYPVFLDVERRRAVVIGGGAVALRKVQGLLEAGASVTVVSPRFDSGFEGLAVERIEREFAETDLDGAALVFAATDVREVNRRAGELARARGIPANIADAPAECAFIVPARIRREGLQIAISTGGEDPARAALTRKKLEEWLDLMRP